LETQLKFGIYYSYWEQEWSADCLKYVEKVARLGFDVIEIAAHHLNSYSPAHIAEVARAARDNAITITARLGWVRPPKRTCLPPIRQSEKQDRRSSKRRWPIWPNSISA
jgi:D-psicose/D-tagatose/L-ribulose 3-epimerase